MRDGVTDFRGGENKTKAELNGISELDASRAVIGAMHRQGPMSVEWQSRRQSNRTKYLSRSRNYLWAVAIKRPSHDTALQN